MRVTDAKLQFFVEFCHCRLRCKTPDSEANGCEVTERWNVSPNVVRAQLTQMPTTSTTTATASSE